MANNTKEALGNALKKMIVVKPIDKITVKDLVEICGVNRQTFYYHFDDVYDLLEWVFEQDAEKVLPKTIDVANWKRDVTTFFTYLHQNRDFALNICNSNSRTYMLKFYEKKLEVCVRGFATLVSKQMNIGLSDFEFVVMLYTNMVVGLISQWIDRGMVIPAEITAERCIMALDNSVEDLLKRFSRR